VEEIKQARKVIDIVSVQNEYNLGNRKSERCWSIASARGWRLFRGPSGGGELARPGGKLDTLAKKHGASVSQLSLAWLLHRSPVMLRFRGRRRWRTWKRT